METTLAKTPQHIESLIIVRLPPSGAVFPYLKICSALGLVRPSSMAPGLAQVMGTHPDHLPSAQGELHALVGTFSAAGYPVARVALLAPPGSAFLPTTNEAAQATPERYFLWEGWLRLPPLVPRSLSLARARYFKDLCQHHGGALGPGLPCVTGDGERRWLSHRAPGLGQRAAQQALQPLLQALDQEGVSYCPIRSTYVLWEKSAAKPLYKPQ